MPGLDWHWFGDIHLLLDDHWAGVVATVSAVFCGAVIGAERQRAQKPAGMRTLILICLGSAIFTQASILIAGAGIIADRSRIAAQVVTGIGFLGAGAIIRDRGLLIGVTTGAGIWATAAVGVVLGSGHIAAGIFFTLLIAMTLAASQWMDRAIGGVCRFETLRLKFDPADGKTRFRIQAILDEHQYEESVEYAQHPEQYDEVSIRFCTTHREHRAFIARLIALPSVTHASRD